MSEDIYNKVLEVIKKSKVVDDVNKLKSDVSLTDQGVDSLDMSNVLFNFEEMFDITVPDDDVDGLATIDALVQYVKNHS